MKKKVYLLVVVLFALVILTSCKQIEDTNGPDNYELTKITDESICKGKGSVIKVMAESYQLGDNGKFIVKKMSGIENLKTVKVNNQTVSVSVSPEVYSGNVKIVLIYEGKIIKTFPLTESCEFVANDTTGTYSLRVAAESGNFKIDYNITVS